MYPFRNLVFQGGGSKAYAYHGALRVLEMEGILEPIERVAGTSAGATLATLLSMRMSVEEILDFYASFDVDGFNAALSGRAAEHSNPARFLGRLQGNITSVNRLATRYGWNSMQFMYEWMKEAIVPYCKGNSKATFADFRAWGFRDLYIVTTNVSKRKTEIFSADRTPDVAVIDALLISQAIPLYFESLQFDGRQFGAGDFFADGGVMLNYPLQIFDERPFARNNRWYVNGVNWESLGCRLYTPENCRPEREPIGNLLSYLQSTLDTLVESQAIAYGMSKSMQRRTINIDDCCTRATDFSIHPKAGDPQYERLVASGEAAAYDYLANYVPPLIKPFVPFSLYMDRAWRGINKRYAKWRWDNSRSKRESK